MQSFIKEGKAKIVQGDATNRSDIKGVIDSAVESGLDVILSSVGKYPAINSWISYNKSLMQEEPRPFLRLRVLLSTRQTYAALPYSTY